MFIINIKKIDYLYDVRGFEPFENWGKFEGFTVPEESITVVFPLP